MSIGFLATSLIVVITPGTGVIYTLATALSRGSRAGVVAAFGCTLGIVPQMAAAVFGLAALLNASALAFQTVKFLGVGYLIYLAWTTLRQRGALEVDGRGGGVSAPRTIATAVVINLLNPKLTVFFFAFLPQFVDPHDVHPIATMLSLSAVFMAMTFVVFVGYGLVASLVREQVVTRPDVMTWMRRTFAGAFIALAAKLALAGR